MIKQRTPVEELIDVIETDECVYVNVKKPSPPPIEIASYVTLDLELDGVEKDRCITLDCGECYWCGQRKKCEERWEA